MQDGKGEWAGGGGWGRVERSILLFSEGIFEVELFLKLMYGYFLIVATVKPFTEGAMHE